MPVRLTLFDRRSMDVEKGNEMSSPPDLASKENIQNLQKFAKSAALLSSNQPRLISEYPSQWIGVYEENVEANAEKLEDLIDQLKAKEIPLGDTIIRFISKERKTLIL